MLPSAKEELIPNKNNPHNNHMAMHKFNLGDKFWYWDGTSDNPPTAGIVKELVSGWIISNQFNYAINQDFCYSDPEQIEKERMNKIKVIVGSMGFKLVKK